MIQDSETKNLAPFCLLKPPLEVVATILIKMVVNLLDDDKPLRNKKRWFLNQPD